MEDDSNIPDVNAIYVDRHGCKRIGRALVDLHTSCDCGGCVSRLDGPLR